MRDLKKELEEEIIDICTRHVRFMLIDMRSLLTEEMWNKAMELVEHEVRYAKY